MKGVSKMDFQAIAEALYHIAETGSTLQKASLVEKYAEQLPGFSKVLKFIYDPSFTTGLKQAKLNNAFMLEQTYPLNEWPDKIMEHLYNSTGTAFDAHYANSFIYASADELWQWAATGLVTKHLQIGVTVTSLNNIFGKSFIPKIGIMRGMACPDDADGVYICTEKIDGNRRLIFTYETGIEVYTRSGKRDNGLVDIIAQANALPVGYVYDTECVATGEFANSLELRQASASILNSGGTKKGVTALIFDMLPIPEYSEGQSRMAAMFRKFMIAYLFNDIAGMETLKSIMTDTQIVSIERFISQALLNKPSTPNIKGLEILGIAHNKQEALELAQPIWDAGGEGIMMANAYSPYVVKSSPQPTLLKIKACKEHILKCSDIFEGEGKYRGMLGGITVLYKATDNKVYRVDVGSGFTDYERCLYWESPTLIIGKYVEVESFGQSSNKVGSFSLNCPVFKRVAGKEVV